LRAALNDNIDHRKKSAAAVVDALTNFYASLFPKRSEFELEIGLRNRFLHVDELRAWRRRQHQVLLWSRVAMVLIFVIILGSIYSVKLKKLRRSWMRWFSGSLSRVRPRARAPASSASIPSTPVGASGDRKWV